MKHLTEMDKGMNNLVFRSFLHAALLVLVLPFGLPLVSAAQMREDAPYMSWDDFVSWLRDGGDGEEEVTQAEWDYMEEKALHPLQLNRVTREDLLALPFLTEAQADSLLSYRTVRRGVLSLGELQLIKGFDYFTRAALSLFARCDSAYAAVPAGKLAEEGAHTLRSLLLGGRHEVETRLDAPLYQRDGYRREEGKKLTKANHYTGNALRHIARYRYRFGQEAAYGLTMEKDAGEPVGKRGFCPYDYWSGYVMLRPRGRRWAVVAGDYELRSAQSLVAGSRYMVSRQLLTASARRFSPLAFSPHTSADESRFYRGAAASWRGVAAEVTGFASYRRVDATVDGDTARTLLSTGLHRTPSEIERRRNLGCFVAGLAATQHFASFTFGLNAVYTRYSRVVWPAARAYNAYYFRGRDAAAFSAVYHYSVGWFTVRGEVAADHRLHWATEHWLSARFGGKWDAALQLRHFTPRFVSLHGSSVQQGGRVANEQGALLSLRWLPLRRCEVEAYADFFRFMKPTYTAVLPGAKGMEVSAGVKWAADGGWQFNARYRAKSVQRTVSGHNALEYATRQSARVAAVCKRRKWSVTAQLDGCLCKRQTSSAQTGWMLSSRATWKPSGRVELKAFASVFFTDSHETALYAYEPQLRYAMSVPSFFCHGMRGVLLADVRVLRWLSAGVRYGSLRYFDRREISSGTERIRSGWKNDLSVQLRLQL